MPVPSTMAELNTTANSNSPAGTESPSNADDFLRAIQAIVRTTNAKGADIASAATTDIGAATGEFVDVTGTTTITGLGTIAAGIVRTVRFTGALTLTHNATSLILPGGANITTAANDRAIFRSLGSGNWLCVAYEKADGTAIDISSGSVTNAKLAFDGGSLGYRNVIIGGNFTTNPWQFGTSFTAPANGDFTADRWRYIFAGTGVVNILKTADSPTAAQAGLFTQHCLHVDVTTADAAMAAGDIYRITQPIEGLNMAHFGFGQAGTRSVTLSFWHKHTKTGIYCVALRNNAANRSYIAEYTQDVSDAWELAEITIPVDTTGTWLYDNGVGATLSFDIASGSTVQTPAGAWTAGNFTSSANQVNGLDNVANNFKIALVQLEAGQTATPFEPRLFNQELALCQYYRWPIPLNLGRITSYGAAGLSAIWNVKMPRMRTTPTVTQPVFTQSNISGSAFSAQSNESLVISGTVTALGNFTVTHDATGILNAEL